MPTNTRQIRRGTVLFHGTAAEDRFAMLGPTSWVSDSVAVAEWFASRYGNPADADATPRVQTYRATRSIRLRLFRDAADIGHFWRRASGMADDDEGGDDWDVHELAERVCRAGFDGWIIPDNYETGDDIMLCDPPSCLDFVSERDLPAGRENPSAGPVVSEAALIRALARLDRAGAAHGLGTRGNPRARTAASDAARPPIREATVTPGVEVSIDLTPRGHEVAFITAYLRGRYSGYITLIRDGEVVMRPSCAKYLDSIRRSRAADHAAAPIGVLYVGSSVAAPEDRGEGVGVALYAAAARVARERFGSALSAGRCMREETSPDALRVWSSRRFRDAVHVVGTVGFWKGTTVVPRSR